MPHQSVAAIGMTAISGLPAVAGGCRRWQVVVDGWFLPENGILR